MVLLKCGLAIFRERCRGEDLASEVGGQGSESAVFRAGFASSVGASLPVITITAEASRMAQNNAGF